MSDWADQKATELIAEWQLRGTPVHSRLERLIAAALRAEREKYHEAMDILSKWENIDSAAAIAENLNLKARLAAERERCAEIADTTLEWCRPIGQYKNMQLAQELGREIAEQIRKG